MHPHRKQLSHDQVLKQVIRRQDPPELLIRKGIWLQLCLSIISQQLSTRVAEVIGNRFLNLFPRKTPTLKSVLEMPDERLREVGLSGAKTMYIKNVCRFFLEHKLTDSRLHKLDDELVIQCLTEIKGVGRWTVEMILMFSMAREDVFAADDLGIRQAMIQLYQVEAENERALRQQLIQIADSWKPYRTYACRYLWRWKDQIPG